MTAKSTCCGFVSLRTAIIIITLIDIVQGIAAGGFIFLIVASKKLVISLSFKSVFLLVQAVIAVVCLVMIILYKET